MFMYIHMKNQIKISVIYKTKILFPKPVVKFTAFPAESNN